MTVLKQLEVNIRKNALFGKEHKLLLAFSGGVDSVVLAHLLHEAGYDFALAHCNFQLRGEDASKDALFARDLAERLNVSFFMTHFDTAHYGREHGLSIQMAARKLRYDWFGELIAIHGYDYVLTAHHAGDNTETLLVNLVRGTGIRGLQGIPQQQKHIARPLLFATKEEILAYAEKHQLTYREDGSNAEVKYKRNFIRHRVIPELKTLNPTLDETIHTSVKFFQQSSEIVQAYAGERYRAICHEEKEQLYIDIGLISKEPYKETLLFEWLYHKHFRPRQITQLCDILDSETHPGKQFSSHSHRLVVDRRYIIVQGIGKASLQSSYTIASPDDTAHLPVRLSFEEVQEAVFSGASNEITIPSHDRLFPLTLRRWKEGDKFRPFGMKGFKKLSDFFKDQKLSLFEKEAVWILESQEHILWVVGYRMDERCRVEKNGTPNLRIVLS